MSAKLEEEVRAQKDDEASSTEGDMRKVPIVNEDLAAKLEGIDAKLAAAWRSPVLQ